MLTNKQEQKKKFAGCEKKMSELEKHHSLGDSGYSAGRHETKLKEEQRRNSAILHISASSPPRSDCVKSGQRALAWLFLWVILCCWTSCGKKTGDPANVLLQRVELLISVMACLLIVLSAVVALLTIRIRKIQRVNKQTPVVNQTDLSTSILDEFHKSLLYSTTKKLNFHFTEPNFDEVEVWVNKVHPGFTRKLMQKVPDMDYTGIRICQLMRLGMTVGITAKCLGLTSSTISKRTKKLCEKLELKGTDSATFIEFLNNL